jgi:long-subunit fatty acid transport protein
MKLRRVAVAACLCVSGTATAGGLFLPGAGAQSTARAGAAVASAEDGEAISLNPAGMAKAKGTTITIGFTALNYNMSFHRNGSYDVHDNDTEPYEGQRYPIVHNTAEPALGIGRYLPIPTIGIVSDLGGAVKNLTVGFGLYTTQAYPERRMNEVNGRPYFVPNAAGGFDFPAFGEPPPPTRYDIIEQTAVIVMPAVAVAYRVLPELDIGARFQAGFAHLKTSVAVWGGLANYDEWIKKDGIFTLDARDNFLFSGGLGLAYRPTPTIELGAHYNGPTKVSARGDAFASNGPAVDLNGQPVAILPLPDDEARCAPGGRADKLKGCVELELPMSATVGARYKLLDADGTLRGDIELNAEWQNWSAERASDFRVVVDAKVTPQNLPEQGINLKDNIVRHGLRDTFGVRLGGSYRIPAGANTVIARGGVGYETGAAKPGWERASLDGAARTMITAGGAYQLSRVRIDAGFGVALQGTRTDSRTCNPMLDPSMQQGCGPGGALQPIDQRQGPDPINPLVVPQSQAENPVNQGTFQSHYVMFMLGMSTWF